MRNATTIVLASLILEFTTNGAWSANCCLAQEPLSDALWGYRTAATYQILPRPATHSNKESPHRNGTLPATIVSKPMEPYAYGWFGTKPTPQWYRSFGNRKAYTQWTLR